MIYSVNKPHCGFDGSECESGFSIAQVMFVVVLLGLPCVLLSFLFYQSMKFGGPISGFLFFFPASKIKYKVPSGNVETDWKSYLENMNDRKYNPMAQDMDLVRGRVTSSEATGAIMKDIAINANNNGTRGSLFSTTGKAIPQLRKLFANLVVFKENIVVAKKIYRAPGEQLLIMKEEDRELEIMMTLKHRNLASFFGLMQDHGGEFSNDYFFLQEYGVRGSLQDVLGKVQITWQVKKSLLQDIASGMGYIHRSPLKYHALLTSASCLGMGFTIKTNYEIYMI